MLDRMVSWLVSACTAGAGCDRVGAASPETEKRGRPRLAGRDAGRLTIFSASTMGSEVSPKSALVCRRDGPGAGEGRESGLILVD